MSILTCYDCSGHVPWSLSSSMGKGRLSASSTSLPHFLNTHTIVVSWRPIRQRFVQQLQSLDVVLEIILSTAPVIQQWGFLSSVSIIFIKSWNKLVAEWKLRWCTSKSCLVFVSCCSNEPWHCSAELKSWATPNFLIYCQKIGTEIYWNVQILIEMQHMKLN